MLLANDVQEHKVLSVEGANRCTSQGPAASDAVQQSRHLPSLFIRMTGVPQMLRPSLCIHCRGSIEATFGLLPNTTPFGSKFNFEPSGGTLPVGQSMTITARLMAGTLGPFNETFNFFIEGSSKLIRLQIKGKVVGPSFQVRPAVCSSDP